MSMRAVLFDMDGTLVDSEALHYRATEAVMRAAGTVPTEDMARRMTGMSGFDCYGLLVEHCGLALPFEAYAAAKQAQFLAAASSLRLREGVSAVLGFLAQARIGHAVVSNSDRALVDASLAATGLASDGLVTISRNDVRAGKPDPEPYLEAARRLGVDPADCLVVEDSIPGAIAGLAAGMTVIGWPEPHRGDLVFPPGTQIADPHDLLSHLRPLLAA